MIKATELRIGNLVQNEDWDYHEIVRLHLKHNEVDFMAQSPRHRGCIDEKEAEPIPLTPEWLERCGFKMMPIGKYDWGNWHLSKGEHHISYDDRTATEGFSYNGCTLWHPTIYLHQLQNLYFALTGEELEVKL